MSMFPTASSQIYRNEDGEVTGWSSTYYDEPEYCDACGCSHAGPCFDPDDYEEHDSGEDDEEAYDDE